MHGEFAAGSPNPDVPLIHERLQRDGVEGVILSYVDTVGISRVKTIPLGRLEHATTWGVGMSPVFDTFLSDDSTIMTEHFGGPDGDLRLVPDAHEIHVLAGQPGWAWAPADRFRQDCTPHPLCQRQYAARVESAADAAGFELRAAIEIEWAVGTEEDGEFVPACHGPAYGMTRMVELSDYTRDVLAALGQEGITVEQLHPEYSDGQFEVSVAPGGLVTAADHSILVRETIRAVSEQHGLRASFSPAVIAGHVGNGGHIHLSVWSHDHNLLAEGEQRHGMTAAGESFLAGILQELPGLVALGAPSPASYLRLVPSHWAGAYACWGHETREAAMRLVTGVTGNQDAAANLEVKCFDLAASPYLVLGAVASIGLAGIDREAELPPEVRGDPAALGTVPRLPQSLAEATTALEQSDALRAALGDDLHEVAVAVRRAEDARFEGQSPEDIAAALRWVF